MPRVCVFDVNETLLDLGALDPQFERLFGDASTRQAWFGQFLTSWLTAMVTGVYQDFGTIGGSALEMVAERQGVNLSDEDKQQILSGMQELPPHPEVKENLSRLDAEGIRLAALTNSTQQVADTQLDNSGLRDYFEQVLSADAVQRLKPAPEPYRMAAESLGVEIGQVRLVAAHAWDVAGGHACRMCRGLRGEAGDGTQPSLRAPGRGGVRFAGGGEPDPRGRDSKQRYLAKS